MTAETSLAFAQPLARAEATGTGDPLDRISLRDYIVTVDIGAYQVERGATQRVQFNLVVEVRPLAGPVGDDVDRILSYERLIQAIDAELAAERMNLLETLTERIALRILQEPSAVRVFVRVEKLDRGPFALGIEIVRSRAGAVPQRGNDSAVHPLVVYMSNAAIGAGDLSEQLGALETLGGPVILCVGLPDGTRPQADNRLAQRRIDLLAMGQNAWVLAGRDRRCLVVESRTEIDWAMQNGRFIVWAPAKLVLDAPETAGPAPADGAALAMWLAGLLGAERLLLVGVDHAGAALLAGSRVPVERFTRAGLSTTGGSA